MTVIENDGRTMLARLARPECIALARQLEGRGLTSEREALLTEVHADLRRIEIGRSAGDTIDCDRCGGPVPTDAIYTDATELQTLCQGCADPGTVPTAAELAGGGDPYQAARRPTEETE